MPTAPDYLRDEWGTDESQAITYLEGRGFKLTRDWLWKMPVNRASLTQKEVSAIDFLIMEWDYGGLDLD